MSISIIFVVVALINKVTKSVEDETGRMKTAKLYVDPKIKGEGSTFLQLHIDPVEVEEVGGTKAPKSTIFRPSWGIMNQDSVVGSTKHSKNWSYNSIPPCHYSNFVTNSDLDGIKLLRYQALATISISFLILFISFIFLPHLTLVTLFSE